MAVIGEPPPGYAEIHAVVERAFRPAWPLPARAALAHEVGDAARS